MKNLLNPKVLIGLGVLILVIVILLATGVLKISGSITKTSEAPGESVSSSPTPTPTPTQKPKVADRAIEFTAAGGKLSFSIKLPTGWSKGSDSRLDFVAGSLLPEELSSGVSFTSNINAIADKHLAGAKSIADYEAVWKTQMLGQYPSMEFVIDSTKRVNGIDVYVLEVKNTRPDGAVIRQIQYVFFVDETYALVVTGSVPDGSWSKYSSVVKQSIESIQKTAI